MALFCVSYDFESDGLTGVVAGGGAAYYKYEHECGAVIRALILLNVFGTALQVARGIDPDGMSEQKVRGV